MADGSPSPGLREPSGFREPRAAGTDPGAVGAEGSLLIVTGPPGAGKSKVAAVLAQQLDPSVLVEGDAFFGFLATGAIEPWHPDSHRQNGVVTRVAASATGEFVRGGYHTVYDGVMGWWFLATFAAAMGIEHFDYVVVLPSLAVALERVAARTGHGFDDPVAARSMHAQFAAVELDERLTITDDVATPSEIAAEISRRRTSGDLRITSSALRP